MDPRSEIVESTQSTKLHEHAAKLRMLKPGQVCSIEDDIDKLFQAMDKKVSDTCLGLSSQASKDSLSKRAMKRPMGPGPSHCSKIGFSDSVSLKQAFRGLSISQASEMAAIKRLSRSASSPRTTDSVVRSRKNMVEFSLVPEEITSKFSENTKLFPTIEFGNKNVSLLPKVDEMSCLREKGESSRSSKESIGEYACSTSTSDESTLSGYRPHMSKDLRWEVIRRFMKLNGSLSLKHFKLIKKVGGGDIRAVYLAELMGTNCLFALKIMDNDFLNSRKKLHRAETEREILQMLDHPFLPSLFAHFTTANFSVLVIEYCPGGDLHLLRQKQSTKSFSEQVARFYVAEVLLALEYLHMLGVVYRDLKPENVIVREDGHIMLSDFDLSLRSAVSPKLLKTSKVSESPNTETNSHSESKCKLPLSLCLQMSWQVPAKTRKLKADVAANISPLPQLVAEPTNLRSNSFVGTHEYLAPEIIRGEGHGSAVDWWALGIFLYELLYGKTPFKGPTNENTLSNAVSRGIEFPSSPTISAHARDLIEGLLAKDPENRLGSIKGAAEIKQHPFFEMINWALIRSTVPPELPKGDADVSVQSDKGIKCGKGFRSIGEELKF